MAVAFLLATPGGPGASAAPPLLGASPAAGPALRAALEATHSSSALPAAAVAAFVAASYAAGSRRRANIRRRATAVDKTETAVAPWEIERETEAERQQRYKREAEEMKLKWDARRLEEKQSAERRNSHRFKEQERELIYGPRDPIMEAYEARMYEEARVLEVCRKQREVYERIKAFKLGRPLPPKGKPFVNLKPNAVKPPQPNDIDVSGFYDPQTDIEALKYKAPPTYSSPTGPAPPKRNERGAPKAAWEEPQYFPAPPNQRPWNYPEVGTVTEVTKEVLTARAAREDGWIEKLPSIPLARTMKNSELRTVLGPTGIDVSGNRTDMLTRLNKALQRQAEGKF